jgi:hypothetical protein
VGVDVEPRHRGVVERDDLAGAVEVHLDLGAVDPDALVALGVGDVGAERRFEPRAVLELGQVAGELEQPRVVGQEPPGVARQDLGARSGQRAEHRHRRAAIAPPHRGRRLAARDQRVPVRHDLGARAAVGVGLAGRAGRLVRGDRQAAREQGEAEQAEHGERSGRGP